MGERLIPIDLGKTLGVIRRQGVSRGREYLFLGGLLGGVDALDVELLVERAHALPPELVVRLLTHSRGNLTPEAGERGGLAWPDRSLKRNKTLLAAGSLCVLLLAAAGRWLRSNGCCFLLSSPLPRVIQM